MAVFKRSETLKGVVVSNGSTGCFIPFGKDGISIISRLPDCCNMDYTRKLGYDSSKILEGLLHNRILLSTISYEQIDGIRYFQVGDTKDTFTNSLKEITYMSKDQLLLYANQSEEIQRRFSCEVWNNSIIKIEKGNM